MLRASFALEHLNQFLLWVWQEHTVFCQSTEQKKNSFALFHMSDFCISAFLCLLFTLLVSGRGLIWKKDDGT